MSFASNNGPDLPVHLLSLVFILCCCIGHVGGIVGNNSGIIFSSFP